MTSSLVGSEMCIRDRPTCLSACLSGCLPASLAGWLAGWLAAWLAYQPVSYTHLTLPTICSV
eukprot:12196478-Prorocentrum_lima.AAC.1